MLELFCRAGDEIILPAVARLTPIPVDDAVASLSAILLDNDYYEFLIGGRREGDGLAWVGSFR